MLANALYCNYLLIAALMAQGVRVSKADLSALYGRRWSVKLDCAAMNEPLPSATEVAAQIL
jgi:hypothetical protein